MCFRLVIPPQHEAPPLAEKLVRLFHEACATLNLIKRDPCFPSEEVSLALELQFSLENTPRGVAKSATPYGTREGAVEQTLTLSPLPIQYTA